MPSELPSTWVIMHFVHLTTLARLRAAAAAFQMDMSGVAELSATMEPTQWLGPLKLLELYEVIDRT